MASVGSTLWSIQYLRAVAALGVVLFHTLQTYHPVLWVGSHGVDLFFVISGFIMVALTDARTTTAKDFLLDRVARIAPPYWLATGIAFVLAALGPTGYNVSTDPVLLAKSLFFLPSFDSSGAIQPTLYLGWTLNYEMFFYVVFALALLMPRGRLALLIGLFVMLMLIGLRFHPKGAMEKVYTDPVLLEFAAGAILGRVFGVRIDRAPASRQAIAATGLALGLAGLGFFLPRLAFGAGAVMLLAGGLLLERGGYMPRLPWLKHLGDASFAIYLFQEFAFRATSKGLNLLSGICLHHPAPLLLIKISGAIAAIGLGSLIFTRLERPMTRAVKRWMHGVARLPLARRAPG